MSLAVPRLSSALEMPSQFRGFSSGCAPTSVGASLSLFLLSPTRLRYAQWPRIAMLQRLLLPFLELSTHLHKRLRNFSNSAYMSIFTSTSTILMILAVLPILDPLLLRNPLRVQLEVLLPVRRVHPTIGVIVLVGITLPIAHATSLVLLHVLVLA